MRENVAAYCIDLAVDERPIPANKLEILEYEHEEFEADLKANGVKNAEELSDWDRVVFNTEKEAESFLKKYQEWHHKLLFNNYCKSRELPALPYRRRHLVLTLMQHKLETRRDYKKQWEAGQLFNLHDRTYFVTVRLKKIVKEPNGVYCYLFELP